MLLPDDSVLPGGEGPLEGFALWPFGSRPAVNEAGCSSGPACRGVSAGEPRESLRWVLRLAGT